MDLLVLSKMLLGVGFRQPLLAVYDPHCQTDFSLQVYSFLMTEYNCCCCFVVLSSSKNMTVRFARRTDVMPPVPEETQYHPSAVDLLLIKRLIADTTKQNLFQFLQHEFVSINRTYAERLIGMTFTSYGNPLLVYVHKTIFLEKLEF